MQVGVLRTGGASTSYDRVMVALHHWVVDLAAENILMGDLESAYAQRRAGKVIQLPESGTSMGAFAAYLAERAIQNAPDAQLFDWLRPARALVRPLRWRTWDGARSSADVVTLGTTLDAARTSQLLHVLQRSKRVSLEEITVSAVASAFADWSQEGRPLLDIEMSARHSDLPGVDLTRSIGWFTIICPLLVELDAASAPMGRLDATVRAMRGLRQHEHEYGMLRYLSPDPALKARLEQLPRAEIFFGYFGDVDAADARTSVEGRQFQADTQSAAGQRSMLGAFRYAVEVAAYVSQGQLRVTWLFNERLLARDEAVGLSEACMAALSAMADSSADDPEGLQSRPLWEGGMESGINLDAVLEELGHGSALECN